MLSVSDSLKAALQVGSGAADWMDRYGAGDRVCSLLRTVGESVIQSVYLEAVISWK